MRRYLLFTSANCKNCPPMKQTVGSLNLGHFEFNVDAPEGAKRAQEFNVRGLPTFIICGGMEPETELTRVSGNVKVEDLKRIIDEN